MRGHRLPTWRTVLAVVAHPDDESFGLGAVLSAFAETGSRVAVLCLTHGEASTLHGAPGELFRVRAGELADAAALLGVGTTLLLRYPDGALTDQCLARLAGDVVDAARDLHADGLVVFDPSGVTGHRDHVAATAGALAAAEVLDLPVLGWTLPVRVAERLNRERGTTFTGHRAGDVDCVVTVDRTRQRAAVTAHASQAVPTSVLWRRLELLGDREHLRRLREPAWNEGPREVVTDTGRGIRERGTHEHRQPDEGHVREHRHP